MAALADCLPYEEGTPIRLLKPGSSFFNHRYLTSANPAKISVGGTTGSLVAVIKSHNLRDWPNVAVSPVDLRRRKSNADLNESAELRCHKLRSDSMVTRRDQLPQKVESPSRAR